MKSRFMYISFKTIIVLMFCFITGLLAKIPMPTYFYSPGDWEWPLKDDKIWWEAVPDNEFYGRCLVGTSRPMYGYTYHFGYIEDVNDTISVCLIIENKSSTVYSLTSEIPEQWVMPVVFNSYPDIDINLVAADSSTIDYRLSHWEKGTGTVTTKPTSIGSGEEYSMIFDVWNLPVGPHVIDFINTVSAPVYFNMKRIAPDQYLYMKPHSVKDTINAYCSIGYRQLHRGAYTAALSWTDSILAVNDSSITGWNLRGAVYEAMQDTSNAIYCFDRVITIISNNHDPVMNLADSVATEEEKWWSVDEKNRAAFHRYRLVTGSNIIAR